MNFNKNTLTSVLDAFGKEKRVFSNEAQFQFELGRELEKKGYKVFFEVLSEEVDEKGKKKKIYTDIVVELNNNNEYVAIELKYKSAGKPSKGCNGFDDRIGAFCYPVYNNKIQQYVFPQGAINEGLYFFLRDVERLEKFINKEIKFNFDETKKITKAYAIIMANSKRGSENTYWSSQKNRKGENKTCVDFSLEDKKIVKRGVLKWSDESSAKNWDTIKIRGEYKCDWKDYYSDPNHNYPIKYMIFDINIKE